MLAATIANLASSVTIAGGPGNAANLQAMTAAQIKGLGMIGAAGLFSTNVLATFSAAQTSAIITDKLSVSAAGSYAVVEELTSGAIIRSSNPQPGVGELTLSTNDNGLTVDAGDSTLSITAGTETLPLKANPNLFIAVTGRTNDTFVFAPISGPTRSPALPPWAPIRAPLSLAACRTGENLAIICELQR